MNKLNDIKIILSAISSYLCGLLGGWDKSICFLLICIFLDYITKLINVIFLKTDKFDYRIGIKGIYFKVLILLCIFLGCQFDNFLNVHYIRDSLCILFIMNECLSIKENVEESGFNFPPILTTVIESLKNFSKKK